VAGKRLGPNGHVKVASGVASKRPRTNRHVILTGSIGSKRIGTHGGIVDPSAGIDTVQRGRSHSCVSTPRTRAWAVLCFERRRKRKPGKCKRRESKINEFRYSFHMILSGVRANHSPTGLPYGKRVRWSSRGATD